MKGTMKEKNKVCVSCGEDQMRKGEVTLAREIEGRLFSAKVVGLVCGACGESIADLQDGERFDLAIAELLSETMPSGDAFRFLRKVAGLRARDLARMLGVSGDTISRWENGKHAIDRSAFFVLGQVVRERQKGLTAMLDLLTRGVLPKALPMKVEVHLEPG
jgi:putative zinc finger/helix-turn-helix YgiT family protein